MRAFLTLIAGTVGGTLISAAMLTSILFVCAGHARDLALSAFTLAVWALGFGLAFLVIAFGGDAAGVLEPVNPPAKEGSIDG